MHWKTNKNQDLNGYWSYYRLAEMYLNYAEAMLEYKGACDEVYDAINVVRTRAKKCLTLLKVQWIQMSCV